MIATMFLAMVISGKPLQAPPLNPRFCFVKHKSKCVCTDTGAACVCVNGECECRDCPTKSPSTPIPASEPRSAITLGQCGSGGCNASYPAGPGSEPITVKSYRVKKCRNCR